ncbi:conserved exported hypothetical protein [Bradyrhizobium sp. ORS 375]|uniref:hypothetical protein n=1 Tax=Bradyrhizobium sp. (strain ORS 375) TaxID=566679 RepID=UPI00024086A0|nr:hypothetical protein [Bradyrhizobium sp. ORS 375]CCD97373.1 conserved exported hypothetical protein [Bradyrhizobium sp. ORS 375]
MVSGQTLFRSASAKIALAAVATTVLMAGDVAPALARSAGPSTHPTVVKAAAGDVTDFSARRRYRRVYRGNPAAGLAIMGAMIGTFGAIAAHSHDDDYYYGPGYYAGPGYYGPPPVYYAPRPYYARPYYGHPYYGPRVHYYYPY